MNHFGLEFEQSPFGGFVTHRFPGNEEPTLFFNETTGTWFLADEHGREPLGFTVPGNERTFLFWLGSKLGQGQAKAPQRMICEIAPESIEAIGKIILTPQITPGAVYRPSARSCQCSDKDDA